MLLLCYIRASLDYIYMDDYAINYAALIYICIYLDHGQNSTSLYSLYGRQYVPMDKE